MSERPNVKIKKANKKLQSKAGTGLVDEKIIQKIQTELEDTESSKFETVAQERIEKFKSLLEAAQQDYNKENLKQLRRIMMQLKADSAMFGYILLGEVSTITLNFLEQVEKLDDEILKIIKANYDILLVVIQQNIQGDGGAQGQAFKQELQSVCNRYLSRH